MCWGGLEGGCGSIIAVYGEGTGAPYNVKSMAPSSDTNSQVGVSPCLFVVGGFHLVGAAKQGLQFITCGEEQLASLRSWDVNAPYDFLGRGAGMAGAVTVGKGQFEHRVIFQVQFVPCFVIVACGSVAPSRVSVFRPRGPCFRCSSGFGEFIVK